MPDKGQNTQGALAFSLQLEKILRSKPEEAILNLWFLVVGLSECLAHLIKIAALNLFELRVMVKTF